jgi:hypothetical protein
VTIIMPRRRFIAGLIGLVAAPAIVRAASLMPVRMFERPGDIVCSLVSGVPMAFPGAERPIMFSGFVSHRRDLADVAAPYRSAIIRSISE